MRGIAWVALALVGCSSPTGLGACEGPDTVELSRGRCLAFEDGGALAAHRATIEARVHGTLEAVDRHVDVDGVRIRVLAGTAGVIPEIGIGGFNPGPREVRLTFDPASPVLEASLASELVPLLAHELHHAARRREVGYGSTLLEAVVSEGLADHFSMEVAGIDAPLWSLALTGDDLQTWIDTAAGSWDERPYDHDRWFFGTGDVPRWAGYAIGFELVRLYLEAEPGRTAAGSVGEPAGRFRPE